MPARLTFRVEARDSGGSVPFDAFAEMASHVANLLAELDKSHSGRATVRWVVRDLRVGSAAVELEAEPLNPLFDTSARVARDFASGMAAVAAERRRPNGFTESAWQETRAIVEILNDGIGSVAIEAADELVLLKAGLHVEDDLGLAAGESAPTDVGTQEVIASVEGSLDTVNGHDPSQRHFVVWDVLHSRRVRCDFPASLLDEVRAGLLERVRVHGRVSFDGSGRPLRVEADSIHVLGRDVSRPSAADLRGLVPGLTHGMGSAEWVRRIRDA
jgi:hypothetical protein